MLIIVDYTMITDVMFVLNIIIVLDKTRNLHYFNENYFFLNDFGYLIYYCIKINFFKYLNYFYTTKNY